MKRDIPAGRDDGGRCAMARKKKHRDKGVLQYISVKCRKKVKALIRELGLELVYVKRIADKKENEG